MIGLALLAAAAALVDPQAQYDHARALEESLRGRADLCARSERAYARALIAEAEAVDRLKPPLRAAAARRAREAQARIRTGCRPRHAPPPPEIEHPGSGEVFFGRVTIRVPRGATSVKLYAGRRLVFQKHKPPFRAAVTLRLTSGRYDLRARFEPRGEQVSRGVWLVPRVATRPPGRVDPRLERALARAVRSFNGWAGIFTHDLVTGRAAGWNADAAFPAASTVKLGVLAAALRAYRNPARSPVYYDLQAMTQWSSNLAANRLLGLLGAANVNDGLRRLGMTRSTYTGAYRVGTARGGAPPRVSGRVTTARDLGRALYRLSTGGFGLTRRQARVGLALLLASDRKEANAGLLPVPSTTLAAQKNGWLDDAQHTAALVYTARGPRIVVVLTYRDGLRIAEARALGRRVARVTLS